VLITVPSVFYRTLDTHSSLSSVLGKTKKHSGKIFCTECSVQIAS
jgi:hypothetical protein